MDEQDTKAWKILIKAKAIGINIENEIDKDPLDITPIDVLDWASTFNHGKLNAFLDEIGVPVWKKNGKDAGVVYLDAYLYSSNEYKNDLLEKLNKSKNQKFKENFDNPLCEVKFTLEVQSNGQAKIVKVDDRPICEE